MLYEKGMLCKHFKGNSLLEKNIYRIETMGVDGKDIDQDFITYTGEKELDETNNLVIYSNIFQEHRLFAREYEDIASELSEEEKIIYNQDHRIEPLTLAEIELVNSQDFINEKQKITSLKFKK